MEDDRGDAVSKVFWEVELKKLNGSLPKFRKPLTELLGEKDPFYNNINGESIHFDKRELEEFSKLIPPGRIQEIRLPIVIMKESGIKKGIYTIDGNDAEIEIINLILGRPGQNKFIYRPEILEMSKRFPSLVTFGFLF